MSEPLKKHSKKEQLLEESLQLIHEKGYKATTMRDLADRMGYKVSNIYNFIDSKKSLLEHALFAMSAEFHKGIAHIEQSGLGPADKLKEVISLHIHLTSTRPYEISLLVNEWRNLDDSKRSRFLKEKETYQARVQAIIEEGMKSGELRVFDAEVLTHLVLSSVRWIHNWYINHSEEVNPVELNRQISGFILRGVENKG